MIVKLYAVHDTLAGLYLPPLVADTDAVVIRDFGDAVRKGNTPISEHPEDYTLEFIGEYDRETGSIVGVSPRVVCHASDFSKKDIN